MRDHLFAVVTTRFDRSATASLCMRFESRGIDRKSAAWGGKGSHESRPERSEPCWDASRK